MSVCPIKCLEIPIDVIASHASTRIYKYKAEQINTISKSLLTLTNTLSHIYTLSDSHRVLLPY
jgi:hypothetical protein